MSCVNLLTCLLTYWRVGWQLMALVVGQRRLVPIGVFSFDYCMHYPPWALQRQQHRCRVQTYHWGRRVVSHNIKRIDWPIAPLSQQKSYKKFSYRRDTRTNYTPLAFNTPTEGFPSDDLREILHGGQKMAKVQNGEEILPKMSTSWVARTNVTDRRQTDLR